MLELKGWGFNSQKRRVSPLYDCFITVVWSLTVPLPYHCSADYSHSLSLIHQIVSLQSADPWGSAVLHVEHRWRRRLPKDVETIENMFLFVYSPVFLLCVSIDTRQMIAAGGQPALETWLWHHLLVHYCCNIIQVLHSRLPYYMTFCFCIPVKYNLITSSSCILLYANLNVFLWPFWPTVLCTQTSQASEPDAQTDGLGFGVSYSRNHILYTCSLLKLQNENRI